MLLSRTRYIYYFLLGSSWFGTFGTPTIDLLISMMRMLLEERGSTIWGGGTVMYILDTVWRRNAGYKTRMGHTLEAGSNK